MARIIQDDRPSFVKRASNPSTLSSNRADQEFSIGKEAKQMLDSFFTTLNDAPSEKGIYFSINAGETTHSNNLNSQKNVTTATRFLMIKDMVIFGPKNETEIEHRNDEEREVAYTPGDQERIILQGTVRPSVGDHWIPAHQGSLARLYMVTAVTATKLIDKPVYAVTLSSSPSFTRETILKNVDRVYKFIFGNIGSQRKTILLDEVYNKTKELAVLIKDLNDMYVDSFYDETYDLLRYRAASLSKTFVGCKALREFQEDTAILRYSEDQNMLFVNYPFVTKDDLKDYKYSYINKIIKRKLKLRQDVAEPLIIEPPKVNDLSITFTMDYQFRDAINEEMEMMSDSDMIEDYEPLYDTRFKFFDMSKNEFNILTNFRKSGITLIELNSAPNNILTKDQETFINYEIKSKLFRYFIDMYMTSSWDEIIKNFNILDNYTVSNNNIDDYLVLPVVLHILAMAIDKVEEEELIVSF